MWSIFIKKKKKKEGGFQPKKSDDTCAEWRDGSGSGLKVLCFGICVWLRRAQLLVAIGCPSGSLHVAQGPAVRRPTLTPNPRTFRRLFSSVRNSCWTPCSPKATRLSGINIRYLRCKSRVSVTECGMPWGQLSVVGTIPGQVRRIHPEQEISSPSSEAGHWSMFSYLPLDAFLPLSNRPGAAIYVFICIR